MYNVGKKGQSHNIFSFFNLRRIAVFGWVQSPVPGRYLNTKLFSTLYPFIISICYIFKYIVNICINEQLKRISTSYVFAWFLLIEKFYNSLSTSPSPPYPNVLCFFSIFSILCYDCYDKLIYLDIIYYIMMINYMRKSILNFMYSTEKNVKISKIHKNKFSFRY